MILRIRDNTAHYLLFVVWILLVLLGLENAWLAANRQAPVAPTSHELPSQQVVQAITKNSANTLYVSLTQINRLPPHGVAGTTTKLTVGCGQISRAQLKLPFSWLVTTRVDRPNLCSLASIEQAYGLPSQIRVLTSPYETKQPHIALTSYGVPVKSHQPDHSTAPNPLLTLPLMSPAPAPLQHLSLIAPPPPTVQLSGCTGNTILTFVAHEDDDLLFTNPDLQHDLDGGKCAVTVFLTAGDDGRSAAYWEARELGSQTAYNTMLHTSRSWLRGQVSFGAGSNVTVAEHAGSQRVYLVFLRLPDGNLQGQGFARSGYASLLKLHQNTIASIGSLDGASRYTSDQLTNTLLVLMQLLKPVEIHTQSYADGPAKGDHSDHQITAEYVRQAYQLLQQQNPDYHVPITFYSGYVIKGLPPNLSDVDIQQKRQIFLSYASNDRTICASSGCDTTAYDSYFSREYSYGLGGSVPSP